MSLLTIAQAHALGVGLSLTDADLQIILDREEAELVRRFGPVYVAATPISETVQGGGRSIYLKRGIGTVSSIVEYLYPGDTAPVTLVAADYFIWASEGRIERVPYGSTAANQWGKVVTVSYIPTDDRDLWRMVLIELVRIATEQTATSGGGGVSGLGFSVRDGDTSAGADWGSLRGAQYARIGWLSR
jgi:hypothetical protein